MLSVPLATLDVLDPLVFRQSIGGLVFAIALSVLVGGSDTGEQERFDIAKLRQVLVAFLVAAALVGVASFDVFLFEVSFANDRDVLRHGLLSVFAIALGTWLLWAMIADRDQAQQRLLDTVVRNTERAMAEKAKLERTAQLAALGEQSATITHELKQPLNAIQLIATNLLRQVERNPRASLEKLPDKMSKVLLMVERAANLADHIRRSSRTTAGDVEQCSFSDALSNARIMIDPAFLAAGLRLDVDVEDELPLLAISGMRLEQVLLNILDNAKHAVVSSKATTPWVKLEARRISDSMVEVRIEDSGGGIPEKALAHVFDQFFTTKNADEGTGIGLGVCRSIIESAGGAITAHNAEYGASFVMRVPISSESVRPEREIH
jgi:C4-dicarboxylate-specific signal transduction histidine kinase